MLNTVELLDFFFWNPRSFFLQNSMKITQLFCNNGHIFFNYSYCFYTVVPYISLLIIPCIIFYVTNKETLTLTYINMESAKVQHLFEININYIYIYISGGPLSALTCCVNVRLLSAIKKISPLIYSQSWVGSWGLYYASYDDFHPDILARMYT